MPPIKIISAIERMQEQRGAKICCSVHRAWVRPGS